MRKFLQDWKNLLEKNPEDRFLNIENIISYINQIQFKKYPFSRKQSIVNNIKFSDYIVREDYSHQLLDYIPIISEGNGKLITLIAGRGAGKKDQDPYPETKGGGR